MSNIAHMADHDVIIGPLDELPPDATRKFTFVQGGREIEAFVLNHDGTLYAYVNQCCHIPMTMDWVDNQFLTDDARFIQCATHGALYEPDSGECVSGPPLGKCLTAVPIEVRDGIIVAKPRTED